MWLMWHMWVLLALSALAGGVIGWTLRGSRQNAPLRLPPRETSAGAAPVQPSTPVKPAAVKPAPVKSESPPEPAKPVSSPAPKAAAAAKSAASEPAKPKPAPEPKAAKAAAPKPAPAPKKSGSSAAAGPDDLTRIKGLGPKAQSTLTAAGVVRVEQVAAWTAADIEKYDTLLNARGRIVRDDWVGQAKQLTKA